MASITSSFMTLKAAPSAATPTSAAVRLPPKFTLKASLKDLAITITATAVLTGNAAAMQVILGSDDGGLVFVPQSFEVAAREKIVFFNNAGYLL